MRKNRKTSEMGDVVRRVQKWFREEVTYEGEPYVIDAEQAAAVADESRNALVVARAGSGKTRTIVAKIVYLVAQRGVRPEEIMAFVFNANAAAEINERLAKMRVGSEAVLDGAKVASTFHAFSRKIVYDVCGGKEKCGKILAGEKEGYLLEIVRGMVREPKWQGRMARLMKGEVDEDEALSEEEMVKLAGMMTSFVNRAQQKYLGGDETVGKAARDYLRSGVMGEREGDFVRVGVECFRRYHRYLLGEGLARYGEYGTDFNLIVSWASKLISARRGDTVQMLAGKKYILIDEYQDFSQLFLAAVMAIRSVATGVKLFAVGDDWQAINRFAGSEVEYFRNFEMYFADGVRRHEITTNYRCDKEIVATARKFMAKAMRDKGEFRAYSRRSGKVEVVDPLEIECGMALVEYDKRVSAEDKIYYQAARRVVGRAPKYDTVRYIKTIVKLLQLSRRAERIFLLHRNNEMSMDGVRLGALREGLRWCVERLGVMSAEEYDAKVEVMTMHKSKGLEAEVVIILEADEGVIPKAHPDTRLYGMFGETDEVALADQKRLFYVAMTRAKRRLYIICRGGVGGGGFMRYLR